MSRPEILERMTTRPDRLSRALAIRQAWQPDARDREIVRRHDEEGQTFAAIAPTVGVSPQRVRYLYHRYWIRMKEREED